MSEKQINYTMLDVYERMVASLDGLKISILETMVETYTTRTDAPLLPEKPDGQLFGTAFWFDEDKDTRVLLAIADLCHWQSIVAVAEHEGHISIYSTKEIGGAIGKSMTVACDNWCISYYVPVNGKWVDVCFLEFEQRRRHQ
jgi:hypothetical protein